MRIGECLVCFDWRLGGIFSLVFKLSFSIGFSVLKYGFLVDGCCDIVLYEDYKLYVCLLVE